MGSVADILSQSQALTQLEYLFGVIAGLSQS